MTMNLDIQVGEIKKEECTVNIEFSATGAETRKTLGIDEDKDFVNISISVADDAPADDLENITGIVEEMIKMSGLTSDVEVPIDDFSCKLRETGGKKFIDVRFILDEDFTDIIEAGISLSKVGKLLGSFRFDFTNLGMATLWNLSCSSKVAKFSKALKNEQFTNFLKVYQNMDVEFKFRKLDSEQFPQFQTFNKVLEGEGIEKLARKVTEGLLKNHLYGLYLASGSLEGTFSLDAVVGSARLAMGISFPGIFQKLKLSDEEMASLDESIRPKNVAMYYGSTWDQPLKLKGRDGDFTIQKVTKLGYECDICGEWGYGYCYVSGDETIHAECAQNNLMVTLKDLPSVLRTPTGEEVTFDPASKDYIGLYFSAHWCGPCRNFTPVLAETYKTLQAEGKSFEIIFMSSDENDEQFQSYHGEMPWLAVPLGDPAKEKFSTYFNVQGIPTLVLLKNTGEVITEDARELVQTHGTKGFPYTDEKLAELDAEVAGEMAKRPQTITDKRHRHELKLVPQAYDN